MNKQLSESVESFGIDYTDGGFMSSRDGHRFKFWDEAFIRPGPCNRDRWVYGDNFQSLGIVETRSANARASSRDAGPTELSMYVNESFWRQCKLRRYTLRLDGFVLIHAPLSGGEVITKPLVMRGKALTLNLATSAAGSIQVEIQASDGKLTGGFAIADCQEIFGDEIERVVEWKTGTDVSQFAGKPIRLRFVLKDADLYAFRFAGATAAAGRSFSGCV